MVSVFVVIFACINTFYSFGPVTVVSYFMVMILFVVVYFKDIKGLILYSFGLLKEMLGMD